MPGQCLCILIDVDTCFCINLHMYIHTTCGDPARSDWRGHRRAGRRPRRASASARRLTSTGPTRSLPVVLFPRHWPGAGTGPARSAVLFAAPRQCRRIPGQTQQWPLARHRPGTGTGPGRRSAARAQATTCGSCGTRSSPSGAHSPPNPSKSRMQCQSVEIAQCRRTARPRPSADVQCSRAATRASQPVWGS